MSVVDIVARHGKGDVVPGEQITDVGEDMPTVVDKGRTMPEITIPEDTDPPKDVKAIPLIEGDGPEITKGQNIVVQYTGVRWDDGEVFDSTWNTGLEDRAAAENEDTDGDPLSFQIGVGGVIEGWDEGLVGQRVGSRVLLVIPKDKAYSDRLRARPAGRHPRLCRRPARRLQLKPEEEEEPEVVEESEAAPEEAKDDESTTTRELRQRLPEPETGGRSPPS